MSPVRLSLFGAALLGGLTLIAPTAAEAAPATPAASAVACVASWNQQTVSEAGTEDNVLSSISGTSPTSLYATGRTTSNSANGYAGRVLRNTGSGWHDVALPNLGTDSIDLTSSVAPTPNTAWVGGSASTSSTTNRVLLHVVGGTASTVALPATPSGFEFDSNNGVSLATSGGTDLWAGADYFSLTGPAMASRVYHQTSSGWTTFVLPSAYADAIAAISPSVAYVGGSGLFLVSGGTVSAVSVPGDPEFVSDIVASSAGDVWLLGYAPSGPQLLDHYDGTSWTSVALPDPNITGTLAAIAVAPNGILWAIGRSTVSSTPEENESSLARFDPASQTWAATRATAATATGNTVAGVSKDSSHSPMATSTWTASGTDRSSR